MTQPSVPNGRPPLHGLPSCRKRPDGRVEARKMVAGRSHSEMVPSSGPTDEEYARDCQAAINKWLAWYHGPQAPSRRTRSSPNGGDLEDNPEPETLDELFERWLRHAQRYLARNTYDGYRYQVRDYLQDRFGDWSFSDLRDPRVGGRIQAYFDELVDANEWTTTIARRKTTLQAAFTWAIRPNGWLTFNPMTHVLAPKAEAGRRAKDPRDLETAPSWVPNRDEVRAFLQANEGTPLYRMWLANWFLGLRPSELVALAADALEVNKESGRPEVVRVFRKIVIPDDRDANSERSWVIEAPKRGSMRNLDASPTAIATLIEQARWMKAQEAAHPEWPERWEGFLFRRSNGWPYDPAALPYHFGKACERAGWERQHPYVMRHYCLSQQLELGVPIKNVASWAGHRTTVNIERTYAHVLRRIRGQKGAGELLEGLGFGSPVGSKEGSEAMFSGLEHD